MNGLGARMTAGMSAMTLFVEELDEARRFYHEVFDLPVVYEDDDSTVFAFGNVLVNLLHTDAARELVEPDAVGWPDVGRRVVYTVEVDDVDAACALLAARGIPLVNGPIDRPWGKRTASFVAPGGHVWEIAR